MNFIKRATTWRGVAVRRLGLALALAGLSGAITSADEAESSAPIQPAGWRSVGPAPGAIAAAIVADAASHTVYISAISGPLLKSTDGGATFATVESFPPIGSTSLAMDPQDPNVVYAAFFKTTDGGVTWSDLPIGLGFSTVIDPTDSSVLYTSFPGAVEEASTGATPGTSSRRV